MFKKIAACAVCLSATSAWAVDDGIYAGGSVGQSQIKGTPPVGGVPGVDDEDTSFKFYIGWRTMDWLAVELGYVDFGGVDTSFNAQDGTITFPVSTDIDVSGFNVQAVGLLKFDQFDLYGKAGIILWNVDTQFTVNTQLGPFQRAVSDDGTDLTFGVGAKYGFAERWAVRLEYEHAMIDGLDDDLGMISAGISWTWF